MCKRYCFSYRSIAAVHKGLKEAKQPDGDEEGKEEGLGSQLRSYMSGASHTQ